MVKRKLNVHHLNLLFLYTRIHFRGPTSLLRSLAESRSGAVPQLVGPRTGSASNCLHTLPRVSRGAGVIDLIQDPGLHLLGAEEVCFLVVRLLSIPWLVEEGGLQGLLTRLTVCLLTLIIPITRRVRPVWV